MMLVSYARPHYPPSMVQHASWLYLRFSLSLHDVEDLLSERGLDLSYETVRRWVARFGPAYARRLRAMRPRPCDTWHLDEMFVSIDGRMMYLWRAVDAEGEVLDVLVQPLARQASRTEADAPPAPQAGFRTDCDRDRQAAVLWCGAPRDRHGRLTRDRPPAE